MRKVYLSKNYPETGSAGNKAKTDIETVLEQNGFVNIGYPRSSHKGKIKGFLVTLGGVVRACRSLKKGDYLVLQYPLKKYYSLICTVARYKGARVITLIHDLGSFRRKKLTPRQEAERLNLSDYIITHNPSMQNFLQQSGVTVKTGTLEIFDYLSDSTSGNDLQMPEEGCFDVIYAGGLHPRKNRFLYELNDIVNGFRLNLYGGGLQEDAIQQEGIRYHGFIPSDQLIASVKGHFGLVWDGDSTETCSGAFGEYLRYNNPHKTSLYLRARLPLIVWSESAMAPFVEREQVGFTVSSLRELSEKLKALTPEQYAYMKENASRVGDELSRGFYTVRAVDKAIESFR